MKANIKTMKARKILDSRGNPTVEVEVAAVAKGKEVCVRAAAPSGASRGVHEVIDFPKGGVDSSLGKINEIAKGLSKVDIFEQGEVDGLLREIDGTPNLSRVGGNFTVAISMAVAKAAAGLKEVSLYKYLGGGASELPYPLGNILGGGKHARGVAPDIQEFIAVPIGAKRASEAVFANSQVHKKVRKLVEVADKTFTGGKGDEGAWAPNLDNEKALDVVSKACEETTDELGIEIRPCLDVAASSLYDTKNRVYNYNREGAKRDPGEQIDFIAKLVKTYGLFFVEDPLEEEDFKGFAELTQKVGKNCLICGDDIFVTNVARIKQGIEMGAANAVLIKPNQIGTLTDTLNAVKLSKENGYVPAISHRSGETPDETIAHLAVAWGAPLIKTGAVGGERIAKLNELIRIEEELGKKARMAKLPFK